MNDWALPASEAWELCPNPQPATTQTGARTTSLHHHLHFPPWELDYWLEPSASPSWEKICNSYLPTHTSDRGMRIENSSVWSQQHHHQRFHSTTTIVTKMLSQCAFGRVQCAVVQFQQRKIFHMKKQLMMNWETVDYHQLGLRWYQLGINGLLFIGVQEN